MYESKHICEFTDAQTEVLPNQTVCDPQKTFTFIAIMKCKFICVLFVPVWFSCSVVHAKPLRENIDAEDTAFTRSLLLSLDYGSNKVFLSRTASLDLVYLSPSIAYEAPSGFFAGIIPSMLINPQHKWDELDLNMGWDFFLFKKTMQGSASYTRFVFSKSSLELRDSLTNNLELIFRKDSKTIRAKLFVDFDFGHGNSDYSFTLDLAHDFVFENILRDDGELKIKPMISTNAGTLNFYRLHLKNQKEGVVVQNLAATVNTKFNLTGVEFSLPLEYDIGRFSFEPAVHYNIPLNQPKRLNATAVTYFTASIEFAII